MKMNKEVEEILFEVQWFIYFSKQRDGLMVM